MRSLEGSSPSPFPLRRWSRWMRSLFPGRRDRRRVYRTTTKRRPRSSSAMSVTGAEPTTWATGSTPATTSGSWSVGGSVASAATVALLRSLTETLPAASTMDNRLPVASKKRPPRRAVAGAVATRGVGRSAPRALLGSTCRSPPRRRSGSPTVLSGAQLLAAVEELFLARCQMAALAKPDCSIGRTPRYRSLSLRPRWSHSIAALVRVLATRSRSCSSSTHVGRRGYFDSSASCATSTTSPSATRRRAATSVSMTFPPVARNSASRRGARSADGSVGHRRWAVAGGRTCSLGRTMLSVARPRGLVEHPRPP